MLFYVLRTRFFFRVLMCASRGDTRPLLQGFTQVSDAFGHSHVPPAHPPVPNWLLQPNSDGLQPKSVLVTSSDAPCY